MTLGLDVAHGLHPLAASDRLQDAWAAFLEELVIGTADVVLVEDLHWAEEQLLELLETLVARVAGRFSLWPPPGRSSSSAARAGVRVLGARRDASSMRLGAGDADRLVEGLLRKRTSRRPSRTSSSNGQKGTRSSSRSSWRR